MTDPPNHNLQGHSVEDAEVCPQDRTLQTSEHEKKLVGTTPPNNADSNKIKLQVTEKTDKTATENSERGAKSKIKTNLEVKNIKMLQKKTAP